MGLDYLPTLHLRSSEDCLLLKASSSYARLYETFEIKSDASLYATGAILLQQDTNGDWHPVAYCSQSMNPMEWNYQVYDRELMAIICEWRCYIYGSSFTTIVWTDHHNLTYFTHPQKLTR